MKPESLEKLKKAAGSSAADEEAVVAEAVEELEARAENLQNAVAFAREIGVTDTDRLVTAPKETAQAFSRDYKAAQSALPKPTSREFYATAQLVESKRREMMAAGWPQSALLALEKRVMPSSLEFASVAMSREVKDGDDRLLSAMDTLVNVYDALRGEKAPPPTGSFAGSREQPRQVPGDGGVTDAEAEGRRIGEQFQKDALAQRGLK